MSDLKQLWDNTLGQIELEVSKANFNTWFKNTDIIKFEDGVIYASVPNQFVKDWLSNKYHKFILRILRTLSDQVRSLEFLVVRDEQKKKELLNQRFVMHTNELPLNELYINKDDNLNPRYTFETFVVGPFNELAFAAAQAVIKEPGIAYNPLFICGNTGLGKTHLMQAVGNYVKNSDKDKKVYYVTSERFALDYLNALQNNKATVFKEKYRKYDILIMDDIQFLSKKEKTQEELFHLFNSLYDNNKQIIFSSDKHPNYLPNMEERLKSRFSAGMIVDIPEPDHESRMAILREKVKVSNISLENDIIDYLAQSVEGNIRELEGVLNSIVCQTRLKARDLTLNEIKNLIKDTVKPRKIVSVKDIIKTISDFYSIDEEIVYKKTRKKEAVRPRQIIMYILREDFHASYPSIGQKIGGRDHTTVIHSCEKIKNEIKHDSVLAQEIHQIRTMLR